MKSLKSFALILCLVAFVSVAYSQGNKISWTEYMTWNETVAPIECIGSYSGEIEMNITWFYGKVLNKASGTITASDGKKYTIESLFNCQLFVRNISASGNSNQTWTFRVRSTDTKKLVAVVHYTFHYEDFNGEAEGASSINHHSTTCY